MGEMIFSQLTPLSIVDVENKEGALKPEIGAPGRFAYLSIKHLRIDRRYQRVLGKANYSKIRDIARKFSWMKFTPLIVHPIDELASEEIALYSVIDGQHRGIAAYTRGIEKVPCYILDANCVEAAEAFVGINGNKVQITRIQVHYAKLAGGDVGAVALQNCMNEAGVTVLKYKESRSPYRIGETLSVAIFEKIQKSKGDANLTLSLKAFTQTHKGNAGYLRSSHVHAMSEAISQKAFTLHNKEKFLTLLSKTSVGAYMQKAVDLRGFREEIPVTLTPFEAMTQALLRHEAFNAVNYS